MQLSQVRKLERIAVCVIAIVIDARVVRASRFTP